MTPSLAAVRDALKPCPFCGDEGYIRQCGSNPDLFEVSCSECHCKIECKYTERNDAIAAWNTRLLAAPEAEKEIGRGEYVIVRRVIDDMAHIAGKDVKFTLRYLEYENDELKFSTGPLDLYDVMAPTQSPSDAEKFDKELNDEEREILKRPLVRSLLYDLNLLPEQITKAKHWFYMLSVIAHIDQATKQKPTDAEKPKVSLGECARILNSGFAEMGMGDYEPTAQAILNHLKEKGVIFDVIG